MVKHTLLCAAAAFVVACAPRPDPTLLEETDSGVAASALRRAPPRPSGVADGTGPEVAFSLRRMVLKQSATWATIGFDLDGYVTSADAPESECRQTMLAADGEGGIDNVFGESVFPYIELAALDMEERVRAAQDEGRGLVVRVRGWNGSPDDPRVDVAFLNALSATATDGVSPPRWDGTDLSAIRDDQLAGGNQEQPLMYDDNAYVTDGVLVARPPNLAELLWLHYEEVGFVIRLSDAVLTGTLAAAGERLDDVTLAGRWSVTDALQTGLGGCPRTMQFDLLSRVLEGEADVRSTLGSGGPSVPCDAVSFGTQFEGSRVVLGNVVTPDPYAAPCDE